MEKTVKTSHNSLSLKNRVPGNPIHFLFLKETLVNSFHTGSHVKMRKPKHQPSSGHTRAESLQRKGLHIRSFPGSLWLMTCRPLMLFWFLLKHKGLHLKAMPSSHIHLECGIWGSCSSSFPLKKKKCFLHYRHKLQIFATHAQCKLSIVIQFSAAKFRPLTLKSMLC